jgi:hypothetical protein
LQGVIDRVLDDDGLGWGVEPLLLSHVAIHFSIDAGLEGGMKLLGRDGSPQLLTR